MEDKDLKLIQAENAERTSVLANERTYAAWIRTGLACFATGLGVAKFLSGTLPDHFAHIIGSLLMMMSGLCFYLAIWRYRHFGARLLSFRVAGTPIILLVILSVVLIMVSVVSLICLWV